jgi:hypothetical protein
MTTISNLTELVTEPGVDDLVLVVNLAAPVGTRTKKIKWSVLKEALDNFEDGTESLPSMVFKDDLDCGLYRIGDDDYALTVGGESILRLVRSGTYTILGHPENFNGNAPYFQVSEVYDTPAIQGQSLFLTGEADTADLALRRINSTSASPTKVLNKEWTGQLYWWPWDGTGFGGGSFYGAATGPTFYDDDPGGAGLGPYNFVVELNEDTPTDIAVFVVDAAVVTLTADKLKVKDLDYTFTYDNGTNALALTFTAGNAPGIGNTIWVFKRLDLNGTAPFYGRQGAIKVIGSQEPSQTGRGAVMTFEVAKNDQIVSRPRMWLDGTTGNLVIASKAVHEGDVDGAGKYYPDRASVGGSYNNGCPSGVCPVDYKGSGSLTILAVDESVDAAISIREWNSVTNGWDIAVDITNRDLLIQTVDTGTKTSRWKITRGGNISPMADKDVDFGGASLAVDDIYADDFQNVADFFHLDAKDDLATIRKIKGSGVIDVRTGIEMIDDATLPEWMLSKDKHNGEVMYNEEGKPYISMKMMTSLLMGACRKLDEELTEIKEKLTKLESSEVAK